MKSSVKKEAVTLGSGNTSHTADFTDDADDFILSDLTNSLLELDPDDLLEDQPLSSISDALFSSDSHAINSLRSSDPEVYYKVSVILKEVSGVEIPFFVLEILKLAHLHLEKHDADRASRLNFEIDNLIVKRIHAMYLTRALKKRKNFDLNLGKTMSVIYRHFYEGVKDMPTELVDDLVPRWPDKMHSPSQPESPLLAESWKDNTLIKYQPLEKPAIQVKEFIPPVQLTSQSAEDSPRSKSPSIRDKSLPKATCLKKAPKVTRALEYGLTFDILSPEPRLFSVYLHPNLDYSNEPKDPPIDQENREAKSAEGDTPSRLWDQVKQSVAKFTRTVRGNSRYFITPQDMNED